MVKRDIGEEIRGLFMTRYYRISFLCFCLGIFFTGLAWAQGVEVLPKGEFSSWHYQIGLDERFRYEHK